MSSPMHLYVFVVPYKPIAGLIPPMSAGEASWPATSVSLIAGERDAVLVDAALTTEDGEQVVKWIEATGKNLTTIYITHGHGDHFFGLTTPCGQQHRPSSNRTREHHPDQERGAARRGISGRTQPGPGRGAA